MLSSHFPRLWDEPYQNNFRNYFKHILSIAHLYICCVHVHLPSMLTCRACTIHIRMCRRVEVKTHCMAPNMQRHIVKSPCGWLLGGFIFVRAAVRGVRSARCSHSRTSTLFCVFYICFFGRLFPVKSSYWIMATCTHQNESPVKAKGINWIYYKSKTENFSSNIGKLFSSGSISVVYICMFCSPSYKNEYLEWWESAECVDGVALSYSETYTLRRTDPEVDETNESHTHTAYTCK